MRALQRRAWLLAAGWCASGAKALDAPRRLALPPGRDAQRLRIAFGSCAKQTKPQPIWSAVRAVEPDLFVFLGDNFYADTQDAETLRQRYADFAAVPELQAFRRAVPHVATWDDHDYGDDDAGEDYPLKDLSQRLFCDAWGEAADSPRRHRPGIYEAYRIERAGRRVQLILLDLRFNRSRLRTDPARQQGYAALVAGAHRAQTPVPGWYVPNEDPKARLLGEPQWQWLAERLAEPADLRLIGSSVQFAAEGTGWEGWSNFPQERARLVALLQRQRAEGVVFLSGDMHYGEVSRLDPPGAYPLWDFTASGLTETWGVPTPNHHRIAGVLAEPHFGVLDIDFEAPQARIDFTLHGLDGRARLQHRLPLDRLRFPA